VLQLSPADRRLLLEAALLVLAIRLGLWLLPFRVLRHLLGRIAREQPSPTGEAQLVERIAWAVKGVSRCIPQATCLTQALAAQVLLQRRGLPARVHIGVARDEEAGLAAHAWVESQGRVVVGGSGLRRYTHLIALERDAR
jgi:hypothetical protein